MPFSLLYTQNLASNRGKKGREERGREANGSMNTSRQASENLGPAKSETGTSSPSRLDDIKKLYFFFFFSRAVISRYGSIIHNILPISHLFEKNNGNSEHFTKWSSTGN